MNKKSSNIVVVNNATPVATPDYADFDDFLARAKSISRVWNVLTDARDALDLALSQFEDRNAWEVLQEALDAAHGVYIRDDIKAEFIRWEAERTQIFNPDSLYDIVVRDGHERWRIKHRVVKEQIALLIGSFPNGQPHNPEIYTNMMVAEILATYPSAIELEATCRTIRRSKNYLPTIKEVLEVLAQIKDEWPYIPNEADDFDSIIGEIKQKVAHIRTKLKARHTPPAIAACDAKAAKRTKKLKTEEQQ
jgi:hypothetical protein